LASLSSLNLLRYGFLSLPIGCYGICSFICDELDFEDSDSESEELELELDDEEEDDSLLLDSYFF
jgi:hypothetical protein